MNDHTTIDLMPCQLCGKEATGGDDSDGGCWTYEVYCLCGIQVNSPFCGQDPSGESMEVSQRWNRMQSLIAKGLLLEATERSGSKGGRL
jgi:hypothetical protein